jgi:hypothetical protein
MFNVVQSPAALAAVPSYCQCSVLFDSGLLRLGVVNAQYDTHNQLQPRAHVSSILQFLLNAGLAPD